MNILNEEMLEKVYGGSGDSWILPAFASEKEKEKLSEVDKWRPPGK